MAALWKEYFVLFHFYRLLFYSLAYLQLILLDTKGSMGAKHFCVVTVLVLHRTALHGTFLWITQPLAVTNLLPTIVRIIQLVRRTWSLSVCQPTSRVQDHLSGHSSLTKEVRFVGEVNGLSRGRSALQTACEPLFSYFIFPTMVLGSYSRLNQGAILSFLRYLLFKPKSLTTSSYP